MALAVAGAKVETLSEMERVFARSEETHQESMNKISKSLDFKAAMNVVQHSTSPDASSTLAKVQSLISGSKKLRTNSNDDGFGGLDGARVLLNSMIHESMSKYDAEIAKCTDYYAKQCALMEIARGQISAANFVAANSRALILDAQGIINQMQKDIPDTKIELTEHKRKCKDELHKMNERLKVLLDDVAIMTMILKMSDCDAKLVQSKELSMYKCTDECTHTEFVTFDHAMLQGQVDKLQSQKSRDLMTHTFADIFEGEESTDFLQVGQEPPSNKTSFNNPPVQRMPPLTDKGAPVTGGKRCKKMHTEEVATLLQNCSE